MAGILANSTSVSTSSGDESADWNKAGFVAGESVTLSIVHGPTPSVYKWSLAIPSAASSSTTALSSAIEAAPTFRPQTSLSGYYVVSCLVDNATLYVLRLGVTSVAPTSILGGVNALPKTAASVPTPALGETLFYNTDTSLWSSKDSSANVAPISPRTGSVTLSSGAATITSHAATITADTHLSLTCTNASNRGSLTVTRNVGTSFVLASSDGADASTYFWSMSG